MTHAVERATVFKGTHLSTKYGISLDCSEEFERGDSKEPISAISGAWTIVKTAGEATKKLYELSRQIKDQTTRQQVDEVLDELRDLKHQASLLEDENRELKAKLRFNSDEYEFRNPFWYKKGYKKTPLCPKCFSNHVAAPIGQGANLECPKCLVCDSHFTLDTFTAARLWSNTQ